MNLFVHHSLTYIDILIYRCSLTYSSDGHNFCLVVSFLSIFVFAPIDSLSLFLLEGFVLGFCFSALLKLYSVEEVGSNISLYMVARGNIIHNCVCTCKRWKYIYLWRCGGGGGGACPLGFY